LEVERAAAADVFKADDAAVQVSVEIRKVQTKVNAALIKAFILARGGWRRVDAVGRVALGA
jgi:hypothetical protein